MTADENLGAAFRFVRRIMDDPDGYPDRIVFLPFDPKRLASIFTEERLRLWREVRRRESTSITELAHRVKRDVSRVRQDLILLEDARLLQFRRKGNRIETSSTCDEILVASPSA